MAKWIQVVCKPSLSLPLRATSLPTVQAVSSAVHVPVSQGIPPGSRLALNTLNCGQVSPVPILKLSPEFPCRSLPCRMPTCQSLALGSPWTLLLRTCTSVPLPQGTSHIAQSSAGFSRSSDFSLAQVFHLHVRRNWTLDSARSWMTSE